MKRATENGLLPEYDFSAGVRGKYVARLANGSNVVVLDRDAQKIFPDSATVNAALRTLGEVVEVTKRQPGLTRRSTRARAEAARAG